MEGRGIMRWNERPREVSDRPPHWSLWALVVLQVGLAAFNVSVARDNVKAVESLRVQVRGLPQVVHAEMDCGCVGGCRCCRCAEGN
jgi:hypothetical protein